MTFAEISQKDLPSSLQDGMARGWKSSTGLSVFRSEIYVGGEHFCNVRVSHAERLPASWELEIVRKKICGDIEYMRTCSTVDGVPNPDALLFCSVSREELSAALEMHDLRPEVRERILDYYRFRDYYDEGDFAGGALPVAVAAEEDVSSEKDGAASVKDDKSEWGHLFDFLLILLILFLISLLILTVLVEEIIATSGCGCSSSGPSSGQLLFFIAALIIVLCLRWSS